MYSDAHNMHLDPTIQTRRRVASSSEQLSPSGLGLSLPLPLPPHLREASFTAENDPRRAESPALSTFSNSFQYQNEQNSPYGSDGSDSPGLHLPVPYRLHRSDRPGAYNGLIRDFLTHRTSGSSLDSSGSSGQVTRPSSAQMRAEIERLRTDNFRLTHQFSTLQNAYDRLANSVRLSSPRDSRSRSLPRSAINSPFRPISDLPNISDADETDYPKVKFWRRSQWKDASEQAKGATDPTKDNIPLRGRTAVAQGENISTLYIEDENGEPVDGERLTAIRKLARSIWTKFADLGQAPKTWGRANLSLTNEYRMELHRQFPEFRFCENHWKADLLATENYPSWHQNHCRKVKTEDASSAHPGRPKKRAPNQNMDVVGQVAKKQKVDLTLKDVETAPSGASKSAGTDGENISGSGGVSSGADSNPDDELSASSKIRDTSSGGGGVSSLTVTNPNKDLPTEPSKLSFKLNNPLSVVTSNPLPAAPVLVPSIVINDHTSLEQTKLGFPSHSSANGLSNDASAQPIPTTTFVGSSSISPDASRDAHTTSDPVLPPPDNHNHKLDTTLPTDPMHGVSPLPAPPISPAANPQQHSPPLGQPLIVEPTAIASDDSRASSKGRSRGATQKSNGSNTARNLCALAWMKLHPGGLAADFKKYFDQLPSGEMKVWKEKEKVAKSVRSSGSNSKDSAAATTGTSSEGAGA